MARVAWVDRVDRLTRLNGMPPTCLPGGIPGRAERTAVVPVEERNQAK